MGGRDQMHCMRVRRVRRGREARGGTGGCGGTRYAAGEARGGRGTRRERRAAGEALRTALERVHQGQLCGGEDGGTGRAPMRIGAKPGAPVKVKPASIGGDQLRKERRLRPGKVIAGQRLVTHARRNDGHTAGVLGSSGLIRGSSGLIRGSSGLIRGSSQTRASADLFPLRRYIERIAIEEAPAAARVRMAVDESVERAAAALRLHLVQLTHDRHQRVDRGLALHRGVRVDSV